jgi:hypothetical protein
VKLRDIEAWTEARRAIAAKHNDLLAVSELVRPSEMPLGSAPFITPTHCALTIVTLCKRSYKQKAFETGMDDPVPVHLQPAYAELVICRWLSAVREGGG